MKVDKFKLEQDIQACWTIVDDIDLLFDNVCNETMDTDQLSNYLLGMKTIYQCKFEKLFNTYETLINDNKLL